MWNRTVAIVVAVSTAMSAETAFQTIARGSDSHIATRRELVIRHAGWWQVVWHKHSGSLDFPKVDFSRQMVIAVFGGNATAGSSIEITSVAREAGSILVRYREQQPVVSPASTAKPSAPFHFIVVPLDRSPVTFAKTTAS